ncbi:Prefoldin, alpha subunit, partial [Globisporangium splendens]
MRVYVRMVCAAHANAAVLTNWHFFDLSFLYLVVQRIEETQAQIAKLQDELEKYADVARTVAELPKKLTHQVMVPLGKRAMMPGKIVRSNEILAHLGDEYFAWQSASSAVATIERKKKNIRAQIIDEENALSELTEKKSSVDNLFDIKKLYEEQNIREIQESEEDSDKPVPKATEEDIEEYFEIEEEERRKEEATEWSWDEMMRRMEELESREASGEDGDAEEKKTEEPDAATQVAELKTKGNNAFARRKFREAVDFYTQAIALEPTSHILYGNRSAAYHRMNKYTEALEDANYAIDIDDTWVKC